MPPSSHTTHEADGGLADGVADVEALDALVDAGSPSASCSAGEPRLLGRVQVQPLLDGQPARWSPPCVSQTRRSPPAAAVICTAVAGLLAQQLAQSACLRPPG